MQLIATFKHHISLEMCIAAIEKKGIQKENIFAIPLNTRPGKIKLFDTIEQADGVSLLDVGLVLGTAFAVVGTSIGFKLYLGPIVWGLMAGLIGFTLGLAIRLIIELVFKKRKKRLRGSHSETILVIDCKEVQVELIESILWEHYALGVAKVR